MSELLDKVKQKAIELAASRNLELVEIVAGKNNQGKTLSVVVGSQKGPQVSDLTFINKELRAFFAKDGSLSIFDDYSLDVCSPGLDRPLVTTADFKRNIERFLVVKFEQNEKLVKQEFCLKEVNEEVMSGLTDDDKPFSIERKKIKSAKVAVRF